MSKQLDTVVNKFSNMSRQEKFRFIHGVRKRKFEIKPATIKRKAKKTAAKKKTTKKAMTNLINQLSPEQLEALLKSVEE